MSENSTGMSYVFRLGIVGTWSVPTSKEVDEATRSMVERLVSVLLQGARPTDLTSGRSTHLIEWRLSGICPELLEVLHRALESAGQTRVRSSVSEGEADLTFHRMIEECELVLALTSLPGCQEDARILDLLDHERLVLAVDPAAERHLPCRLTGGRLHPTRGGQPSSRVLQCDHPIDRRTISPGFDNFFRFHGELSSLGLPVSPPDTPDESARVSASTGASSDEIDRLKSIDAVILPCMTWADQKANQFQLTHSRVSCGLFWLGSTAVTIVMAQTLFFPDHPGLVLFEVFALAAAMILLQWSRAEDWHGRWLAARFLAEELRQLRFLALVGLGQDPYHERRHESLAFYKGPQRWLLDITSSLAGRLARELPPPTEREVPRLRAWMKEHWIEDQLHYHSQNADRKSHLAHRYHVAGLTLFGTTIFAAILHMLGVGHSHGSAEGLAHSPWNLGNLLTFLAVTLPAWGSAMQAVENQLELHRIVSRSRRMTRKLKSARARLIRAETIEELRAIAEHVRLITGAENHEWLALLGFRDPRLPA